MGVLLFGFSRKEAKYPFLKMKLAVLGLLVVVAASSGAQQEDWKCTKYRCRAIADTAKQKIAKGYTLMQCYCAPYTPKPCNPRWRPSYCKIIQTSSYLVRLHQRKCAVKNKRAVDFVDAVLQMADPQKKTSVDLKKLTGAEKDEVKRKNDRLLRSIGCGDPQKDKNGNWNCIGALEGVEISGDGIITKKSLLDHA